MICTIPNSMGTGLREYNHRHEPGGSPKGGQFAASDESEPAVLHGVDSAANAEALSKKTAAFRALVMSDVPPRQRAKEEAISEAVLRSLPFVHGTSVEGVVGAFQDGLLSSKAMEPKRAELKKQFNQLLEQINADAGQPVEWRDLSGGDPAEVQELYPDLSYDDAKEIASELADLHDLRKVIDGTTADADRALGLDQMVFMTHGDLHQDYGNIGVIVDNAVFAQGGWATPKDIVVEAGQGEGDGLYPADGVERYKQSIVKGDDYFKTAAQALRPQALPFRSRDQLWEIKVPRVPKSAILGVIVKDDLDTAERLNGRLNEEGFYGKVLYADTNSKEGKMLLFRELRAIQKTGRWDENLVKRYNDRNDGANSFIL